MGAVGDKGPTGDKGPDGDQGPPGNAGADGNAGVDGAPGADGSQGADGDKGPTGDKGATGDQGPPGNAGADGNPGADGSPGATGDKGPTGDKGADGDQGPQGEQGPAGSAANCWPIGSVFISVVSTNPATLLGVGTWSAIGAGKVLVGIDAGDADFDTVEESGGSKTKTIAQANLPDISTGAGTAHTHVQDQHRHQILRERSATTGSATTQIARTADTSSTVDTAVNTEYTTPTNQNEEAHTHSLGGSGTALNVMNPYFVVYIWKRTS